MQVGDVLYRRIDGNNCIIKGFFFLHRDNTQSLIYENLSDLKHLVREVKEYIQLYVLFHDDTFDTVENLYTNLYMTVKEYNKMRTSTLKLNDLKLQLLRDIPKLPIKDKLYWTTQIENCRDIKLAQSLVEGLKKKLIDNADGLYSAFQIARSFPTTEYVEQESYEGQHAEEPYWREEDLVPNPK